MGTREETLEKVNAAIDHITESTRINGAESPITEFILNYITGNADEIADMLIENAECDAECDAEEA